MIIQPDFLTHWRTRKLVRILDDEAAPLCLIRLWGHCQSSKQWRFNITIEVLQDICEGKGHPLTFFEALEQSGFVEMDGETIVVCNWDEHNAALVSAWENGKRGGRKKAKPTPKQKNRPATDGLPTGSPSETGSRIGVTGVEPIDELDRQDELDELDKNPPNPPRGSVKFEDQSWDPAHLQSAKLQSAWSDFLDHRKRMKPGLTPRAAGLLVTKLCTVSPTEAVEAIHRSIESGWKGIFPEKNNGHRAGGGTNRADAWRSRENADTDWGEATKQGGDRAE